MLFHHHSKSDNPNNREYYIKQRKAENQHRKWQSHYQKWHHRHADKYAQPNPHDYGYAHSPIYAPVQKKHHHWLRDTFASVVVIIIIIFGIGFMKNAHRQTPNNKMNQPRVTNTKRTVNETTNNNTTPIQKADNDEQKVHSELNGMNIDPNEKQMLENKYASVSPSRQIAIYNKVRKLNRFLPTNGLRKMYLQKKISQYQQNHQ